MCQFRSNYISDRRRIEMYGVNRFLQLQIMQINWDYFVHEILSVPPETGPIFVERPPVLSCQYATSWNHVELCKLLLNIPGKEIHQNQMRIEVFSDCLFNGDVGESRNFDRLELFQISNIFPIFIQVLFNWVGHYMLWSFWCAWNLYFIAEKRTFWFFNRSIISTFMGQVNCTRLPEEVSTKISYFAVVSIIYNFTLEIVATLAIE